MGTDHPLFAQDGESPRRFVKQASFRIDPGTATNERFARFVEQTNFITDAERFGWSYVFQGHIAGGAESLRRVAETPWWCRVDGASWRHPSGVSSTIAEYMNHPVVHVSHNDAAAYAAWAGGQLPSEAQWEHAARGGKVGSIYPWGDDEPDETSLLPCNIWQGRFPDENTGADGYAATAPACSFEPNGYGIYNMCGNVWEWCADPFRVRSLTRSAREINTVLAREKRHLLKGGSFLCHRSYCHRYRIAARTGNTPDTSTSHIGFRLVYRR